MDSWSVTLICISCHVVFLAHNDVHIGAKMADTTNNLISFYLILASANLHNGLTPCILSMVSSNIMQRSTICIHHHTSSISWPYFSRRHLSLSQTKATKAQRSNLQQNDATTKGMIKISNPSSHSSIHPPPTGLFTALHWPGWLPQPVNPVLAAMLGSRFRALMVVKSPPT